MPPYNTIVVTPFTLPTVVFANGQVTGNPWNLPTNMFFVDGDVSSANASVGAASDVTLGGYNFQYNGISIPQGAIITGIELEVIGYRGAQTVPPITLDISLYDNVDGANNFYPYTSGFTGLTPTMSTTILGTPTYLFASSFTVDQINNLKVNLQGNGDINLDSFLVRVYFYIPAPATPPASNAGLCIECDSPIQVQAMYLELPFLSGESTFYLKKGSFAYPNGTPVQPGDVGACGGHIPFVFDEGKRKSDGNGNFEENAMLDTNIGSWSVLPSGVIQVNLGAVTQRGLDFKTPGTFVATLMSDHDANSKVIISNNTPYNLTLVRRCQADTVFSPPIDVEQEGADIVNPVHTFNFTGGGVAVSQDGTDPFQANINIPGTSVTPPVVVGTGSGTSGNVQVSSLTFPLTTSGVNRGVLVQVSMEQLQTITSITFNGVPLTQQVVLTDAPNNLRSEQWFLVAPFLGTANIVITLSGASYISAGAEALVSVNQATPVGALTSNNGTSLAPTEIIVTTVDNSLVFDSLVTAQTPILYTPGPGQTSNWAHFAVTDTRQGSSTWEAAGTAPDAVTLSYAITQNTDWVMTGIEILGLAPAIGSQVAIQFEDESGAPLGTAGTVDEFEITGPSVVGTRVGNKVTYTISATGGSGGSTFIDQTPDNGTYGLLGGAVDGVNAVFTVSQAAYLTGTLQVYRNGLIQLQGVADEWTETNPGIGTFTFVVAPLVGDIITVVYQVTAGGGGSGEVVQKTITQLAHGFSDGDVLRSNGVDGQFTLAEADTAANADVVGIVTNVIDANNFVLTTHGFVTISVLPGGTVAGDNLYLDPAVAGALTLTDPAIANIPGTISQPLGRVINAATNLCFVNNWRGQEQQSTPAGSGSFTVNSDENETTWWTQVIPAPFAYTSATQNIWTPSGNCNQFGNWSDSDANGGFQVQLANGLYATDVADTVKFNSGKSWRIKFRAANDRGNGVSPLGGGVNWAFIGFSAAPSLTEDGDITDTDERYGFAFYNGRLYTIVADGATISAFDTGAYVARTNTGFSMVYTPGVSVEFFINGVSVRTEPLLVQTAAAIKLCHTGANGTGGGSGGPISQFIFSQEI